MRELKRVEESGREVREQQEVKSREEESSRLRQKSACTITMTGCRQHRQTALLTGTDCDALHYLAFSFSSSASFIMHLSDFIISLVVSHLLSGSF